MSLFDYIPFIGDTSQAQPTDGAEALNELLRQREETLDLTAVFHQPVANIQDEPTALLPYTLVDRYGDDYGAGTKEFPLPDKGFDDNEAALTQFVARAIGIAPEDTVRADLFAVEGTEAPAEINDDGDITVPMPETTTEATTEEAETEDTEAAEEEEEE